MEKGILFFKLCTVEVQVLDFFVGNQFEQFYIACPSSTREGAITPSPLIVQTPQFMLRTTSIVFSWQKMDMGDHNCSYVGCCHR